MIQEAIAKAVRKENLSKEQSKQVFDEIMKGQATQVQIGSFITALATKGESADEIAGAAYSLQEHMQRVECTKSTDILDIVGTGGDGKGSFNVSTAAAIVAAGAGCIVAKHGNRGFSSKSGSADVLEALGVNVQTTPARNSQILSKIGFVFLFAPLHHPAMKYASAPRKEIGIRTIFNIIGPLSNPASASTYLIGTYSEDIAKNIARALLLMNVKKALVVTGSGYDEATLSGKSIIFEVQNGNIVRKEFTPQSFGFSISREDEFSISNPQESAKIIIGILEGNESGPRRDIVVLNAGLGIYANGVAKTMQEGIELAKKSIDSRKALSKLGELVEESNK
ncbi:MAG TPA: anthranilate phosphoribosyltransferase [archaeon]|nr:anthranilate phosphoribosyltransferase [archaeon]